MEVRLFATLRDGRGKILHLDRDGADGYYILQQLEIDPKDVAIYLVNGHKKDLAYKLNNEDTIALFPPVGGG